VVPTGILPSAFWFTALLLQQCHFLRQAGHSEKAIALFQAMVDFTFFKPDSVKDLPTKVQVPSSAGMIHLSLFFRSISLIKDNPIMKGVKHR
jgi:hypothetical protein